MGNDFFKAHWDYLTDNTPVINTTYYHQLIQLYTSENRFYHNLTHIKKLLTLSEKYQTLLNSPETVDFAIWYHDAIYNTSKNNNEEKSAELAKEQLSQLAINPLVISDCCKLILATKKHQTPNNLNTFDAKFLLDIDLSILAAPQEVYFQYTKQIRMEYYLYSDFQYKKGRKKVLEHFLSVNHIYKTQLFKGKWEQKARDNISYEISTL